ncbi:hypothetical protein GGI15_000287 [Coemansia interrupta]|uniref:Nucleoporin Pom152 n=1 Tax=Coemansia interrupta TaxID=1126814 RepID=A0A9W8LNM2_9FUNG|nr:hypothetical protein GGI15_000287 [Coemansia interrupta]
MSLRKSGAAAGTPVGSKGLTQVGTPNRVQKRTPNINAGGESSNLNSSSFLQDDYSSAQTPKRSSDAFQTPRRGAASPVDIFQTPMTSQGAQTRSGFAERVYQSTGGRRGFIGTGSGPGIADDNGVPRRSLLDDLAQDPMFGPPPAQQPSRDVGGSGKLPVAKAAPVALKPAPKQSASAIPEAVVDLPSQRTYLLGTFGILLAWKIYNVLDLLADESRQTSVYMFAKWCFLDTAMCYVVWMMHIPGISVSRKAMYLLILLCVFIDLNMFLLPTSIFVLALKPMAVSVASGCMRSVKSIPWLGPRLVGDNDLLIDTFELDDEHILGRHTIHILPHSLAHMNPQTKSFCIDSRAQHEAPWYSRLTLGLLGGQGGIYSQANIHQQVAIPILINGTHPASIHYAYTSFETGERQVRKISNVGALQVYTGAVYPSLGNWVMATYYLPVTEVGAYEIVSVKDVKGLEFRTATHAPPTIVVSCPKARLQWRTDVGAADNFSVGSDGHASICQRLGSSDSDSNPTPGTNGLIEVVVEGYEPIDMNIVRLVNGHREVIGLDGVQPRISEIPAALSDAKDVPVDSAKRAEIERWSRYRARRSVYTLSDAFLRPGEYVYKLESIRDAANHSVALGERNLGHRHGNGGSSGDKVASSGGLFDGEKMVVGKATSYMARVHVHERPTAAWTSRLLGGELPLRLSDDKLRKSKHLLPLKLSGSGPWTVEYEVVNGDEITRESQTFSDARDASIEASKPGSYRLAGLTDSHCSGTADRSNVTLVLTPHPAINVTSAPIMAHECGGEIGAQIELELSGRPPFAVHYRERNLRFPNSRALTRVVRTQQRRHTLKIVPELAGTYEFEFFRLEDDNYPSGQAISEVVRQAIHAQPSVRVDPKHRHHQPAICMGQSFSLPLVFKGNGPWQLMYNVVHDDRRHTHTVTDIVDEHFTLDLGSLDSPGEYTVELVQVKDGNMCARDLMDIAATVKVREGGPRAAFQCPSGGIRVLDGEKTQIPVILSGEYPIDLKYRKIGDPAERVFTAMFGYGSRGNNGGSQISGSVPAYGPGEYELIAADDICPGTVDPLGARCTIKVEPKPSAWFTSSGLSYNKSSGISQIRGDGAWQLASVCEGTTSPGAFELGLSGSGPWRLEYRVDFWQWSNAHSGDPRYVDRSNTHTAVAMQQSTLKAECCDPGLYRYTLTAVSDERYQRLQRLEPGPADTLPGETKRLTVVEHRVTRSPQAELRAYLPDGTPMDATSSRGAFGRSRPPVIKHCLAPGQSRTEGGAQTWANVRDRLPVFRVEFEKDGLAPFDAWIEVFPASGPSEVVAIREIAGYSQAIALPEHIASQIGRYHMRLVRTRDARGCEHHYVDPSEVGLGRPDKDGKAIAGGIEIEYIEAPSARPASASPASNPSRSVCVGDILAFDLRGLNSWNVDYIYNGHHRSTHSSKRLFRRLADEPGTFALTSVCHRSANDCCSEFTDLNYTIHDIPRVRVSGGKNVYQDILEGDMADIRLDLVGTPPFTFTWQRRALGGNKVLESHTVKDFDGKVYVIPTSSEGTFEVTFIQDRFCQYPKA